MTYAFTRELYVAGEIEYRTRRYDVASTQTFDQFISTLRLGVRY